MSQMNRRRLKTDKNKEKLKTLQQKLKDAMAIQAKNKAEGKRLSSGRAKAIAQMEKDIAALKGKSPTQQQQVFDTTMKKMSEELKAGAPSPRKRIREANKNRAPSSKGSPASQRRFLAKTELARQKEMDAVGPGPDMKKTSVRKPKLEPLGPTKDIKQRSVFIDKLQPLGPNRPRVQAEKEVRPKGPDTSPRKKPGRFSEERFAKFFKDNFGVTLTFDADDERQAMEDRGEGPSRAKGGFVTRRGGLYNKPARKK